MEKFLDLSCHQVSNSPAGNMGFQEFGQLFKTPWNSKLCFYMLVITILLLIFYWKDNAWFARLVSTAGNVWLYFIEVTPSIRNLQHCADSPFTFWAGVELCLCIYFQIWEHLIIPSSWSAAPELRALQADQLWGAARQLEELCLVDQVLSSCATIILAQSWHTFV